MGDSPPPSVTQRIEGLKQGDSEAARQVIERYFACLVALARRQLADATRRDADEIDVALSVFESLCQGAEQGRFLQLTDANDFWRLLLQMTHHKTVNQIRRQTAQKRGGGEVRGDSVLVDANVQPRTWTVLSRK